MIHEISVTCLGEFCGPCSRDSVGTRVHATHKVGEEIAYDDSAPNRHNLTSYVCCACFRRLFGWCTIDELAAAGRRRLAEEEGEG